MMPKRTSRRILAITAALAGLVAPPAGAELVVDDFVTSQTLVAPGAATITAPEVIGGERDVELLRRTGSGDVSLVINAIGEEELSCSAAAGTEVGCILVWDGPDGVFPLDPVGLGGIDLTEAGATGFWITVATDVPATLQIQVTDVASGGYATGTLSLPGGDAGLVTRFLPFADFVPTGTLTPMFDDAGSISLDLEGDAGLDAQIGSVTVPGPAQGGLAAAAALGVLVLGRRLLGPPHS